MKTCSTCRFMAAERDDLVQSGHRTCVRIVHGNGCMTDKKKLNVVNQPAAVVDGSGYAARLVVLPTFGCVLHEGKP